MSVTNSDCCRFLCSNLKKFEESVACVQRELEENEKSIAELTEQLKKLEDEAGEIMKDCQEAEVGTFHPLWLFYISSQEKKKFVFFCCFCTDFFLRRILHF